MNKKEFLEGKQYLKDERERLVSYESNLRRDYISANKPFDKGTFVHIVTAGGRAIAGEVKEFAISKDAKVFVSTIKPEGKPNIYISVPYKSIKHK